MKPGRIAAVGGPAPAGEVDRLSDTVRPTAQLGHPTGVRSQSEGRAIGVFCSETVSQVPADGLRQDRACANKIDPAPYVARCPKRADDTELVFGRDDRPMTTGNVCGGTSGEETAYWRDASR